MLRDRPASLVAALVLGCAPLLVLEACGGSSPIGLGQPGADAGGGGGGDGATTPDATSTGDGARGSDSSIGSLGDGASDSTSGGPTDGGGGTPDVACVPGCPASAQCGLYTDCTGNTLACGQPCAKGETCVTAGASQTCQPTATACAGQCGIIAVDPCGVSVSCGGCPAGHDCVNNKCVPQRVSDAGPACGTLTCSSRGQSFCGTLTDGCGKTMQCACPTGLQCNAGLCLPPPPECDATDAGAARCGNVSNACGSGMVPCGGCTGAATCVTNTCTGCPAPSCNGATCGEASNACGQKLKCGVCASSETCYSGACCTPMTCAEALDGGATTSCAPVDVGCGQHTSCAPCGAGETCLPDGGCCQPLSCADFPDAGCGTVDVGCGQQKVCATCGSADICVNGTCVPCQPKTCADYQSTGCGLSDGCGKKLDCCPPETSCQGNLCCPIGQVNYQGTCCQPQCDTTQPPGPQESCGQIILCSD